MADDGTTDSKSSPEAKSKRAAKPKAKRAAKPKAKRVAKPKAKRAVKAKAKSAAKPKAKRAAKAKAKSAAKPKAKRAAKAKAKSAAKAKPKAKRAAKPKAKRAAKPKAVTPKSKAALEIVSSEATLEAKLVAAEAGACATEADTLAEVIAAFRTPEPDPLPPLPVARGRDFVLAMIRDPESAFIYWELTPEGAARARAALGGRPAGLTLRVYLTPEGGEAVVHDYPVEDWIGRYVLTPNAPGQRLVAAVGYKADDAFAHISRATAVDLPRRWPKAAPLAFTRVVDAPPPRPVITVAQDGTRQIVTPKAAAAPFVPVPVDFVPAGVDADVIQAFRIEQAVAGDGPKTDLQRIWGSNHLVPAEG